MMTERYLHWAKTHPPARFELTVSGAPRVSAQEFGIRSNDVDTIVQGTYGHPELIARIAALHGVAPATVLPVPGASMANFIALACAVGRGKRVAIESPAYEPLLRTAEFLGLEILRFERDPRNGLAPDVDQVATALRAGARAVVMTDLHNPSGRLCPADVMQAVAARCAEHGAYVIVDEVYRDFAHINRGIPRATASLLGPNVIVTNSLTKAYGLGGLRAGWLVAAPELMERARARGVPVWSYNAGADRLSFGFHPWAAGLQGRYQWHYAFWKAPYDIFAEGWGVTFPSPEGPLPTPEYERTREGIEDWRWLNWLERLCSDSPQSQSSIKARALLDSIRKDTPLYLDDALVTGLEEGKGYEGGLNARMVEWRRQVQEAIIGIMKRGEG